LVTFVTEVPVELVPFLDVPVFGVPVLSPLAFDPFLPEPVELDPLPLLEPDLLELLFLEPELLLLEELVPLVFPLASAPFFSFLEFPFRIATVRVVTGSGIVIASVSFTDNTRFRFISRNVSRF